ncbi:hypothetical protein OM076_41225 [Solirubrobacter ginsenosidimutans]|uniref:Uncharacterized protein n=1 Tax=Solirubrobacter ginsenosidimutans TaxID=490573 RepID=A0A9X3S889_9ACTN|nr:hypothetical protein [Solirubrobacter ginsenosidimutans]MDA0166756.1 hypothetical protein [Solirubrobacter ginsenosidimutans]
MTRRFDIGPFVLALAALVLLVSLFLPWVDYGAAVAAIPNGAGADDVNAWRLFEITDLLLAALAIAAVVAAAGLITPAVDLIERRWVPWIVGAAFVLVANQILEPHNQVGSRGTGAWLAFAATVVMVIGAVLSLTKVSVAVGVEGRDRRRRVAAVDHRPPPTEAGAPVQRSSTSLLTDPPEAGKES